MNPLYLIDMYKLDHREQYPAGITQVWTTWTPRASRISDVTEVVHLGLQYFIKKILLKGFEDLMWGDYEDTVDDYRRVVSRTLGVTPKVDHIEALLDLGYLPLDIYSIPEGRSTPLNCPSVVITNTHPDFFWLPNYIETMLSAYLWKPSTSATTAKRYRKLFEKYAKLAGETDLSFVDYQGHDFSMRGMSGVEDAVLSGLGHLSSFKGTDTLPAMLAVNEYYGADLEVCSVQATEHSVMSAGGQDDELETFRRLITETYPTGIVSIVSDTWDLWRVLTDYVPQLAEVIKQRDGVVTIRPDSGDPVKIICGDPYTPEGSPQRLGTLRLLQDAVGSVYNGSALPMLNKMKAIYGDSITVERADQILDRMVHELKLSPYNMIFGIGSYTYEYVTRDTFGFAMKATAVRQGEKIIPIWKKPVTDSGTKFSHKGITAVYEDEGSYRVQQESSPEDLANCALEKVYSNGKLLIDTTWDIIRQRVRS